MQKGTHSRLAVGAFCFVMDDWECAPLSGCGTQHPLRALGGTRVLLATAPTTPPCFRRWRRSSSLRSAHHQRNNYFIFRVCRALRSAPNAIFTGGVVAANCICSAAFCESAALRACPLPHGGAVAQRLRGYKWRSEKSVKAIAPTGAALAFLCFDFFFRIVKGVQPLARCGVGGVQR